MVIEIIGAMGPEAQAGLLVAFRNIYGWWTTSNKDGKIDRYEWKKLGQTVLKYGVAIGSIILGADAVAGSDVSVAEAAALTFIVDMAGSYIKKNTGGKK